jgi:alkylation response protein AidB-like acyl-CoA dehydrogenase
VADAATRGDEVLATARSLADDLLFPRLVETDGATVVPRDLLDRLARAGLYGAVGPVEAGGLGLAPEQMLELIEVLAGGCLSTAFVWLQHHGTVRAVAEVGGELADRWLGQLCSGETRSGVAFAGLRRPGPPVLTATPHGDGYVFEGMAPWLTGWGAIDVALVAARDMTTPAGDVVWAIVDAVAGPHLRIERLTLAAMDVTATVRAGFDGYEVPADRVVAVEAFDAWVARDAAGLRANGSMPLGLAGRAASLVADDHVRRRLEDRIGETRSALDAADVDGLPNARAVAAELALEAATSLVVERGGAALVSPGVPEVLARQAMFLLVFGQTRTIKAAHLALRAGGAESR